MFESVVEAIKVCASNDPDKFCVADGDRVFTYNEFYSMISSLSSKLQRIGLTVGKHVVIQNAQNIETLVAVFAVQLCKGIAVIVDDGMPPSKVAEIAGRVSAIAFAAAAHNNAIICEQLSLNDLCKMPVFAAYEGKMPRSDDVAEILFTTGTTGTPKGIVMSNGANIAVAQNVVDGVRMSDGNIELLPMPLSHSHSMRRLYANMLNHSGAVIVPTMSILTDTFFECIETHHVSAIDLAPTALVSLMTLSKDKLEKYAAQIDYVQIGGAMLRQASKNQLRELLPSSRLYDFYGTTESGCTCILDFASQPDKQLGCIGLPTINAEYAFMDDEGNVITPTKDAPGLLAWAGAMNMNGYFNAPDEDIKVFNGRYIVTQDLGYRGDDGMIYLLGRRGDVINTGGIKVSPDEIEAAANMCPLVKECVCVPVEHDVLGQEPKLFVVPAGDFDAKKIQAYLKSHLEESKIPQKIEMICEIPRSYNGKVLRRQLMRQ